jgi:hypothetical protein
MSKKLNIKSLLIIFAVLLVIVVLVAVRDSKKGDRSFKVDLIPLDSAQVTAITIYPRSYKNNPIKLQKESGTWKLLTGDKSYTAEKNTIKEILNTLIHLKAERVAATDKGKWATFEVNDTSATRVTLGTGKKSAADLYIGKFSYQQPKNPNPSYNYGQQGKMTTYVRLADDKNVYAVNGFLSMMFNRKADAYRNKTIINSDRLEWTRLSFNYPGDSSFVMNKENNKWMINGLLADSTSVMRYFNSIYRLVSSDFVDNEKPQSSTPEFSLKIEGKNFVNPIQVDAYVSDTTNGYLIATSQNKDTYFSSKKSKLAAKLFFGKNHFLKKQTKTNHN